MPESFDVVKHAGTRLQLEGSSTCSRRRLLAVLLIALMLPVSASAAKKFYVAVNGNDAWSGRRAVPNRGKTDGPFATLEKARDAVRKLKERGHVPSGGITVWVRGGNYKVAGTFKLEAEDSGSEKSPIVYRAFKGEKPVFSGAVRVTDFKPVSDPAILARLPEESRTKVVQADLKALGITDIAPLQLGGFAGGLGFRTHPLMELFFNGHALPLARWPNQGFVHVAKTGGEATAPGGTANPIRAGSSTRATGRSDGKMIEISSSMAIGFGTGPIPTSAWPRSIRKSVRLYLLPPTPRTATARASATMPLICFRKSTCPASGISIGPAARCIYTRLPIPPRRWWNYPRPCSRSCKWRMYPT